MSDWQAVDWDADRTRAWWRRWTADTHVSGAEFRVIATRPDGACVALWLVDTVPPVVFLGSDGTAAMIASSRREFDALTTPPEQAVALESDFATYAHRLRTGPAVRTATVDDAADLQRLIATMGYDVPAATVRTRLDALPDQHVVYVAVTDRVIGWVHVLITHSLIAGVRAELGGIAADAESQGAGTALLSAAERWAARHGADSMYVRSGSTRTAAHRFYEKRGYTVVKTQLALTKPLTAA
ncbi:GNAT family N-acetyltransferase [Catenuloplanes japonicus]|uniref:GNAT family N-acetyltransferase n=1 Tax=Catenuloplanes japonicus TaxID=33876 RepID=UPI000689F38E|nr:GNAT family N-acetyltransferase [Catenuloplanes japonicus]